MKRTYGILMCLIVVLFATPTLAGKIQFDTKQTYAPKQHIIDRPCIVVVSNFDKKKMRFDEVLLEAAAYMSEWNVAPKDSTNEYKSSHNVLNFHYDGNRGYALLQNKGVIKVAIMVEPKQNEDQLSILTRAMTKLREKAVETFNKKAAKRTSRTKRLPF